jgi:Zn-dependent metalloprotease
LVFSFSASAQDGSEKKDVAGKIDNILQGVRYSQKSMAKAKSLSTVAPKFAITKDGYLRFLSAPPSHYFPVTSVVPANAQATAKNFMTEHKTAFGLRSEALSFTVSRAKTKGNRNYIRFQQTYGTLPVFGAQTIVQVNEAGGVEYVLSEVMRNTQPLDTGTLPITPAISPDLAQQFAVDMITQEYPHLIFEAQEPNLMIYEPSIVGNTGATQLVWQTTVLSIPEPLVAEFVLVDAHNGQIALHYSLIMDAMDRIIFDANNTDAEPGACNICKWEGGGSGVPIDCSNAYDFLGDTYNFYLNYHGRDSIDGYGATMRATVRYCLDGEPCPWSNACWIPVLERMYFGEDYAVDDVVTHEMTHGVTQHESDLIYLNQSGAINGSFSDMWGEWVDQTYD